MNIFDNVKLTFEQQNILDALIRLDRESTLEVLGVELGLSNRRTDLFADCEALRYLGLVGGTATTGYRYVGPHPYVFRAYQQGKGIRDGNKLLDEMAESRKNAAAERMRGR